MEIKIIYVYIFFKFKSINLLNEKNGASVYK